ncbi:hypothetical protein JKG68_21475 [Microvirga aerilata]|uniref:DUF4870 domain-containing protein n=1 Tax=Microvirga aerilata TaxID=670292 RepID=A0A936Z8W7_9HYPH|nr:hypothetical protein [Microvirga aerilata]MBL0406533.1 hypothetical protein [Microvirga aerilata]
MTSAKPISDDIPQPAMAVSENPILNSESRTFAMIAYVLFLVGIVVPLTPIVGLIISYVKRGDATGTPYATHYPWLIRTFWISFALGVVGLLLTVTYVGAIIGLPILIGTGIYYLYKVIKGIVKALEGKPVS